MEELSAQKVVDYLTCNPGVSIEEIESEICKDKKDVEELHGIIEMMVDDGIVEKIFDPYSNKEILEIY